MTDPASNAHMRSTSCLFTKDNYQTFGSYVFFSRVKLVAWGEYAHTWLAELSEYLILMISIAKGQYLKLL